MGISEAKCEFIAYLDDDDEWYPTKLEKQYNKIKGLNVKKMLNKIEKIGLVSCYSEYHFKDGTQVVEKKKENVSYSDLLKNFEVGETSSFLVRKEALIKAGCWTVMIRGMQEYDVALRIARAGYKIVNIPEPLLKHYDVREGGIGRNKGYIYWKISELFEFFKYYKQDLKKFLGWKGVLYRGVKLWVLVSIYLSIFVLKYDTNNTWKISNLFKRAEF